MSVTSLWGVLRLVFFTGSQRLLTTLQLIALLPELSAEIYKLQVRMDAVEDDEGETLSQIKFVPAFKARERPN